MKINPISNNLNFGYSKALNRKLTQRLNSGEKTKLLQVISKINDTCNFTEDTIRQYERQGIDNNQAQIDLLLDYFFDAKTFLCRAIERIYPDLNYMKKECDQYDRESMQKRELPPEAADENGIVKAYIWRDEMVDGLIQEMDLLTSYTEYDDVDEEEFEDFENASNVKKFNTKDDYEKYLDIESSIAQGKCSLIEKFVPSKNSPKSLDDVVGLDLIRDDIKELVIYPLEHPEEAKQRELDYGIEIPHFIVFHGAPGCGKTMLAQAISAETGCDMYNFDLSKIGSGYVNETAQNIDDVWEYIKEQAKGKDHPVILFLDEMDSYLSKRLNDESGGTREDNKAVNALLTKISEAYDNNIIVIGATNRFDMIDPAIKRRVNLNAYIGLPKKDDIVKLLKINLSAFKKGEALAQDEEALNELSEKMLGHSPSNIINIIKSSSKIAYKNNHELTKEDVIEALSQGSWEKINEKEYMPQSLRPSSKIGFNK